MPEKTKTGNITIRGGNIYDPLSTIAPNADRHQPNTPANKKAFKTALKPPPVTLADVSEPETVEDAEPVNLEE